MTTVAYRDGVMAGDTALTDRGVYCAATPKVFRNDAGDLFGFAGCLVDLSRAVPWFLEGAIGNPPEFRSEDSEGLLVHADGTAEWLGGNGRRVVMSADFFALGSGFKVAMGALAAGATAERAVEIACDLDIETRRPVIALKHVGT